jgi:hypothetical protein
MTGQELDAISGMAVVKEYVSASFDAGREAEALEARELVPTIRATRRAWRNRAGRRTAWMVFMASRHEWH